MKKHHIVLSILLAGSSLVQAQELDSWVKAGLENNPGIKAKYLEFEAAMQKAAQVSSLPDPNLNLAYFITTPETRVGSQIAKIGLSQMFPWFGTLKNAGNAAAFMAEAKHMEFVQAQNELRYEIKEAWYSMIEVQAMISIKEENLRILETLKVLSTASYKNGKGSMVNIIRADLMIEAIRTDIQILNLKLLPLRSTFNNLLDRSDTLPVELPVTFPSYKEVVALGKDTAFAGHPMLNAIDQMSKATRSAEVAQRKMGLPKFGLGLDYVIVAERSDMMVEDNGKDIFMPMVNVSLPIYRKKYKAAIKEQQLKRSALDQMRNEKINDLSAMYDMAAFKLSRSLEMIRLSEQQLERTAQALNLIQADYKNSGKDFEEILRLQQELLKHQMSIAEASKELFTAIAKIEFINGK